MATAFETFVDSELPKKIGYATTPVSGNSTALTIPQFTGTGLTIQELALSSLPMPVLSDALSNGTYSGITFVETVGENVSFGDLLYLKSDGNYWRADSVSNVKIPCIGIAVGTALAGATVSIMLLGFLRNTSWTYTVAAPLYVGSGVITATAPSGTGKIIQLVGQAKTADIVFFNANQVFIELA